MRGNRFIRRWTLWRYLADYFPVSLVKTCELDPDKSYFMGIHPHGIISFGGFCALSTDALGVADVFPGIQVWTKKPLHPVRSKIPSLIAGHGPLEF